MRIIIAPAKKMRTDMDSFPCHGLPEFLLKTETLYKKMQSMSYDALKSLWKCNDQIATINFQRLQMMDLRRNLTPALLAYEGIQYQYIAPGVFTQDALDYVKEHLRILSGFYGVLRPFDGVTPYRLEMQARLAVGAAKNLYDYWGNSLAEYLFSESECVLNLSSKEYSLCVSRYVPEGARYITCVFGERKNGKIIEKGTLCKMARGEMVRFLAEQHSCEPEAAWDFDRLGFRYSLEESDTNTYVFIKEDKHD